MRVSACVLIALGCLFHLPRLFEPLGVIDACGGAYYGVFIRYYEEYGFTELRGMPLWRQLYPLPTIAEPYLNHPPGLWWLMYWMGGTEAAMRVPSIVGAILTSTGLCWLVRRRFGGWAGFWAGAIVLGTPAFTVYSQITPDTVTAGIAMVMWIATVRVIAAPAGERAKCFALQAACAFCGTWVDWSFGMFCFGLSAIGLRASWRVSLRALGVPAIVAIGAAVLVVLWQRWGLESPLVTAPVGDSDRGFWGTLEETIGMRPSLDRSWGAFRWWLPHIATSPVGWLAIPGVFVLFRRDPRLATALFLAGITYLGFFADHAILHPQFYIYLVMFLCVATACLVFVVPGRAKIVANLVLCGVTIWVWGVSYVHARQNDSTFHRDFGEAMCEAAIARGPDGEPTGEKFKVTTNFAPIYPYYVTDPDVLVMPPITDVAALRSVQRDRPFRYVLCIVEKPKGIVWNDRSPELEAFLAPYPRTRLPHLEQHLYDAGYKWDWRIVEAWLVDVPQAE